MTGISTDFQQDPRYQRAVQKMARMLPEHRKTLDTAMLDRAFTTRDLRNKMRLAALGEQKLGEERQRTLTKGRINLARDRLRTQKRLSDRAFRERRKGRKFGEKMGKISSGVALADVLGSAWLGHRAKQESKPKAGLSWMYNKQYAH